MLKKIVWAGFKFLGSKCSPGIKSVSLVELLISIMAVGIMVLSFYSLETFSHKQVLSADRRTKVQNTLAYCFEHMGKYIQLASGYQGAPPIVVLANGFKVRVDHNLLEVPRTPPTPGYLPDDVEISYTLTGNTLSTSCAVVSEGTCGAFVSEALTGNNRIVAGFDGTQVLPANPTSGFYVYLNPSDLGNFVDIGLVGVYDTTKTYNTPDTHLTNPMVAMRAKISFNNSSSN